MSKGNKREKIFNKMMQKRKEKVSLNMDPQTRPAFYIILTQNKS